MADTETTAAAPPYESQDSAAASSAMDDTKPKEKVEEEEEKVEDKEEARKQQQQQPGGGVSLRIWPPTQKTRDAVINRLIETLSTPSILSKRYGTLPSDDAAAAAKAIEEEAYGVASDAVTGEDSDGIEILQVYSKEISKRMLDSVKSRSSAAAAAGGNAAAEAETETDGGAAAGKEDDAAVEAVKEDA